MTARIAAVCVLLLMHLGTARSEEPANEQLTPWQTSERVLAAVALR